MKKLTKKAQRFQIKMVNIAANCVVHGVHYVPGAVGASYSGFAADTNISYEDFVCAASFIANCNTTNEYEALLAQFEKDGYTSIDGTTFMASTVIGEMFTITARVENDQVVIKVMAM